MNSTVTTDTSSPCKGICIPESSKFLLVESEIRENLLVESRILGFGIRDTARGIRNPTNDWNPKSTFHLQGLESGIQDWLRVPYMARDTLKLSKCSRFRLVNKLTK